MELLILISFVLGYGILYTLGRVGGRRAAERLARFVLDTFPEKHMAIDEQLELGQIDSTEARAQKDILKAILKKGGHLDGFFNIIKYVVVLEIIIAMFLLMYDMTNIYVLSIVVFMWVSTFIAILIQMNRATKIFDKFVMGRKYIKIPQEEFDKTQYVEQGTITSHNER